MTRTASDKGNDSNGLDAPLRPAAESGTAAFISPQVPLRTKLSKGFYLQENEVPDIFLPIIGPFAGAVIAALARKCYGEPQVEYSVRDLARSTGMSAATVARALHILKEVGLVRLLPTSGNRKSVCELFDVKALAASYGAKYEREAAGYALPPSTVDRLKAEVKALRRTQQGKSKATPTVRSEPHVEIAPQGGMRSLFSVSSRDASVSPAIRKRFTRETQTGTHLLLEEKRIEEVPSPTPSHDGEAQKAKDSPDENEPDPLLRWARIKFTGVMKDMGSHLLDSSKPPSSHLVNGAADWQEFGFNSLAVEAAAWHSKALALVLSANDPAAARRGLEKYHRKWDASLRKWFDCEVYLQLKLAASKR